MVQFRSIRDRDRAVSWVHFHSERTLTAGNVSETKWFSKRSGYDYECLQHIEDRPEPDLSGSLSIAGNKINVFRPAKNSLGMFFFEEGGAPMPGHGVESFHQGLGLGAVGLEGKG